MLVVDHEHLSDTRLDALRSLFDSEYLASHGAWDPDRPYGYSPAGVHVMLVRDSRVLAHVGFQRRLIAVGDRDVCVAGTGGVLVHREWRSAGVGRRVMSRAQEAMIGDDRIEFGYLGCREEVVPFYESTGWSRVHAAERHVSMHDRRESSMSLDGPIMVFAASGAAWPGGDIDLRGTPW